MKTAYTVTAEFATPALRRRQTFVVQSLGDVQALKRMGSLYQFEVKDVILNPVRTSGEVVEAILEERRACAEAGREMRHD